MTEQTTPITPRGLELKPEAARAFAARTAARQLLHSARMVALATLDPGGYPYNTMTNLIVEPDGTPAFFAAGLTVHARNIAADPRICLTMAEQDGADMMTAHRLSLSGLAERVPDTEIPDLKDLYARRHPKSKLYLALPDMMLFRLRIGAVQINGGPARNANDVAPADFRIDLSDAGALMAEASGLIAALDTSPDTVARLAARAGAEGGRWRVISLDPEGLTLAKRLHNARLWFPERITTAQGLRDFVAGIDAPA